jgi:phosphoribosylanthranilate isomerase
MMNAPIIQVAGIRDLQEAMMLVECGVTDLGFPLKLDVHEEDIDEKAVAEVIGMLPRTVSAVVITYLNSADEIIGLCNRTGAGGVQLHGDVGPEEAAGLRRLAPGLGIIKSLVVRRDNREDLGRAATAYAPYVDAFLTDTYDPSTGASGATGKTHDWSISRELAAFFKRPLILAGGLDPENVREAVRQVRPAGVDAHSGLEGPDGRKDRELVQAFVKQALAGFADIDRLFRCG